MTGTVRLHRVLKAPPDSVYRTEPYDVIGGVLQRFAMDFLASSKAA